MTETSSTDDTEMLKSSIFVSEEDAGVDEVIAYDRAV